MRTWTLAVGALAAPAIGAGDWGQFARGPERVAASEVAAPLLSVPRWVRSVDSTGLPIAFVGQAGVVVDPARVYAIGKVGSQFRTFGVSLADGGIDWETPVPAIILDSRSTPAVGGGAVIVATGRYVTALDATNGEQRWQTMLDRSIVDASPLLTTDRGPRDRVFITDYDGFGGLAKLYCINADSFDASANPYQPGQIVWSAPIGGSSGNSPAYHAGVVYVAGVTDESGLSAGRVLAFDAGTVSAPPPLWVCENPAGLGFFSGVCVSGGAVYCASYAFSGGQTAANLVKLDAVTGSLRWSVPCNRTDSTPIPLPGGLIALSGGVRGFGSAPSIELFRDDGASAVMLWDSALATWDDANNNQTLDPGEYLALGGWSHQPAAALGGGTMLVTGVIGTGTTTFAPCTDVYTIDLSRIPTQEGFVQGHIAGMGSTPALLDGAVYTIGAGGLYALGAAPPLACVPNCDASTIPPVLNVQDFSCFLNRFAAGDSYANCDASTIPPVLNVQDFSCFLNRFAGGCS